MAQTTHKQYHIIDEETEILSAEKINENIEAIDRDIHAQDEQIQTCLEQIENIDVSWEGITGKPIAFPPSKHGHPYSEISGVPTSFPPSSHTHDDRYYTEAETNNLLAGKSDNHSHPYAPSSHTHIIANVTGLQGEIDSLKSSVSSGKTAIASAITAKGVSASGSDTHATLANKVGQIKTAAAVPSGTSGVTPYLNQTGLPYQKMTKFVGKPSISILNKVLSSAPLVLLRFSRIGYYMYFTTTADIFVDGTFYKEGSEIEVPMNQSSSQGERWIFIYNPSRVPIKVARTYGDIDWGNGDAIVYDLL